MHKNRHSQQQFKIIGLQYRIHFVGDDIHITTTKVLYKCEFKIKRILNLHNEKKKMPAF